MYEINLDGSCDKPLTMLPNSVVSVETPQGCRFVDALKFGFVAVVVQSIGI